MLDLRREIGDALRMGASALAWAADRVHEPARVLSLGQFELEPEEAFMALQEAAEQKRQRHREHRLRALP
jgi:hypothetical protein